MAAAERLRSLSVFRVHSRPSWLSHRLIRSLRQAVPPLRQTRFRDFRDRLAGLVIMRRVVKQRQSGTRGIPEIDNV